ncbi:hypothetical protein DFJ43DRAFT_1037047 [Lentinula guzmanii]|uniref:Uncharacterized protein n=1 Tax=Lentinula guzmanii TaxID=2804957 RepID=A0AA38JNJ3_9AGAR|nr:hypothetical protein DFJ43DRAFT_1037047 [Lentinula guzmanii]
MSRRRPTLKLRALYALRRARATSLADRPGFLYAFVDRGRDWKLGMTSDFDRQKAQWDKECPCAHRRWLPPIRVSRRRRAGLNVIALTVGVLISKSSYFVVIGTGRGESSFDHCFCGLQYRHSDVSTSVMSRHLDVSMSGTHILTENILKNLMGFMRRI